MSEKQCLKFNVNGKEKTLYVKPNELLLNVLRNELGLMGTRYGCGIGECGACTVLINDQTALACMTLAVTVAGQNVTTVEGLGDYDHLHPLQESFVEHGAVQCGFCTSGMLVTAKSLLDENPNPTEEDIRDYLRGNLCRCTGYTAIVEAVKAVAHKEEA